MPIDHRQRKNLSLFRDVIEMIIDDAGQQHPTQIRRRTSSHGSMGLSPRSRAASIGSSGITVAQAGGSGGVGNLHKKALSKQLHNRLSRDETMPH